MYIQNQFSCFLIGEGTLLIQCAELLLERGHQIFGVISRDVSISSWAKAKHIPHIPQTENLIAFLRQQPFDYLFNIVNRSLLPKEILELPRQLAINYHDAPLPKYAGLNATSWALMHREKTHGVTWYVISNLVEGGDILKQVAIDIADDDTAFSLNGKCDEAAIRSFEELVDDISSGQALANKQNLDELTYLGHSKRLFAGGVLSFNRCAYDMDADIRALDFGSYPNALGVAKLSIGSDLIIIPKLEVKDDLSKSSPGTITAIEPNFLTVSTASYEVVLRQVLTIDGQALSIPDLVERFGLQVGYKFKDIEPDRARRIERFDGLIGQHEDFWVKKLATLQPITVPYADPMASHLEQKQYTSVKMSIPHEVTTFLEERQPEWNKGDFLFAAFAIYLGRIGGTGCFDIGFRDVELQRELVGIEGGFASIVSCRVDIDYEQSFEEVFKVIEEQVELTKLHKTYARDVVARYPALRSLPDRSREPIFPVVVERVEKLDEHQAGFGNELTLVIPSEGKECCWLYNTEALDGDSIARMLDQFATFLQGIVTDPKGRVADLPLLSERECHKILVEWNDTQADYPKDKCIHQLFEAQVEQTPDAMAVVYEDKQLTYRELNGRANQLAHYLQKLGVGPEVLVGIFVERSLEMMVGLLAILKAGGAYVPLDPAYPKERLGFMLSDSQVSVLLTQEKLLTRLPEQGAYAICLDTGWGLISQESEKNLNSGVNAANLAYIIYTSGSTGKPKGTMIVHQGLVNYLSWCIKAYAVADGVGSPVHSSIGFDATITSLFSPLLVGQRVVFLPEKQEIEALSAVLCSQSNFSLVKITPAHLALLSELLPSKQAAGQTRALIIGGEALSKKSISFWQTHAPETRLINEYGPTETVVGCCIYEVPAQTSLSGLVPIGRPIANTQLYILDRSLQPVPIGVTGELHIGGDGLARGYLNRTELTTQKFIPNPFSNQPGERLYKTGDLARYLPDGNIEFLGRIDNQVKIRGFRIELGEIEAVLMQNRAVQDAVVIDQEYDLNDKRLVAYVVPSQEQVLSISELRRDLKQKLPEHMIPSAFVQLEAVPLTPNGKVDRRALPVPDGTRSNLEETFVPHLTPFEEVLAGIWSEVLRLEWVGIHDNFFELGGHSLLATQVISRVREAFGVELPLHTLFEEPTLAGLAKSVETASRAEEKGSLQGLPISLISREGDLPLSFAQQRLWFLDQLMSGTPLYNLPNALGLKGSLNVTALEQSLSEIVRRHEALRTTFSAVNGQPIQVIHPAVTLLLPIVDLRELPETEREVEAQRLATEEAQRPFDLVNQQLFRVKLLHLAEEEHLLLLTMHHIVSDGWSLGVFMGELTALYEAFSTEKSSPLPELPIQYADFAAWQNEWLVGEVLEVQLNYWKRHLGGQLPVLDLPTDRPRPPVQTYRGARQSLELPKKSSDALKALSQQEGVTLFMTLLAVFQILLYRYTGQEDVIVGSPIANRNRVEVEGLIGFFVNTLVLRTELSGEPSFRELLGRVREVALGAYAHQDLPFEKLVEELQLERDLSRNPLFQVMFVLQNAPISALEFRGLSLTPLEVHNGTAKFDLTLELEESAEGIRGWFEYNTDLFDTLTITRMTNHFQTLVEGIVDNPEQRLCDLPLLSAAQQHQLLVEWNNTQTDYPNQACIHQLFEAQVELTPNAVAVVFENEQLTYQQLNYRANQLAHHLQKMGVEPEMLVGICVERSLEMIVGLLGILKAGGAYLPLDPSYPHDRLAFMLEDAQVSVLLTQQKLVAGFSEYKAQRLCLDTDWEVIAQESEEKPLICLTSDNLAYTIYTSGSTGKPKGVLVTHQNLVHSTSARISYYSEPVTSFFLLSSFAFDSSIAGIFWTLCQGGILVIPPANFQQELLQLTKLIAQHHVSHLLSLPSLYNLILDQAESQQLTCLRSVIVAGEPCSRELVERHTKLLAKTSLFNEYGPTEGTVWSSVYHCQSSALRTQVPIGRPIANMQIYLLDKYLNPVPIGVQGELHIGGEGIARGYLNRPELTKDKFIPNPFSNEPGTRLYKTGDLARYLPDGNIEFLGRIDNQVKIRGFRIELGEVESTLSQYPTVQQCVVTARVDIEGDKRLVAYIVSNQQQKPTTDDLRCFLKQRLPDYMVPSAFVFLDTIPLTPNGKIDQRALPAPDGLRQEPASTFVPPSDDLEIQLTKIWENVLRKKPISVKDNFFDVGGHSLLAVRLLAQIEKAFGKNLPLATLFQSPTIEQLANILRQKGWSAPSQTVVTIQPGGSKPPLFFFHVLGEGLKFCRPLASHLDPEQPIYGLAVGIMDEVSLNKIEDLVAHYLKEMRIIQPEGPYLLAGIYCGGRIAYEVAQQLHAQGQKVALLALLDTLKDDRAIKIMPVEERVLAHWNNFLRFGPAYLLSQRRLEEAKNRLMSIYCEFYERMGRPLPPAFQSFTYRKKKEEGNMEWEFAPKQVYPERVTLFRPMENMDFLEPDLGWSELAPGGLEIHDVPGNTFSMLQEPHVQVLAEKLRECIDRVQADDFYHVGPINDD
ncbi:MULTISPECIES: amino acid adenylation domain-containing protein [unclassified Microcoleus]|uniref:amino acid adenylation domain-containing protein n=1 Tax=unclassified Microcoleus TaxID=2642155 RepID=UPI002FD72A8C